VVTEKRKGQTFDGVGLKEEWMLKPRFILPWVGESR
jgi:hypothetical protein